MFGIVVAFIYPGQGFFNGTRMPNKQKITIKSGDGAASQITLFRTTDSDATVIICMPAMGVWASYYEPLAHELVLSGRNVITADLRGKGESLVKPCRGCDFGYHEMVYYDWPEIVEQANHLFPHSRKVLLGHSLGGQLSTLYMSATPGEIDGLVLVACPSVHYRGWPFPHNIRILLMTQAFRFVAGLLGYFPGKRLGFAGTESKTHITDWAYTTLTGRYKPRNSTRNYEALLLHLKAPVLAISFSDDGFAPRTAVERLCAKIPGTQLTHWYVTPQELGLDTLGHVGWVKRCQPVVKRISEWLAQVVE